MCTVKSASEIMVCDVSRDRVREELHGHLGDTVRFETVHGEGTRCVCEDPERIAEFQSSVGAALGWAENGFPPPA